MKKSWNKIILITLCLVFIFPDISHSATFGYTSLGASTGLRIANSSLTRSIRRGQTYTGVACTLDSISVGVTTTSGSYNIDIIGFVSTEDTAGDSHAKVASAESLNAAVSTTDSWITLTGAGETLTAVAYVLNTMANGEEVGAGDDLQILFDGGGASRNRYLETFTGAGSYATGKEDPWTNAEIADTNQYSIYVTCTEAGGGASPVNTPHIIFPQGVLRSGILQN